jgi:AraC-like DNA-binding protein
MHSTDSRIRRFIHPISEKNPVYFTSGFHETTTETRYDMHFGLELGLVLSGTTLRLFPGHHGRQYLKAGQVWTCGMWEPHGYKIIKAPCEDLVWIIWPPLLSRLRFEEAPGLNWLAPFQSHSSRPLPADKRCRILEIGQELKNLVSSKRSLDKAVIRIALMEILITLMAGHHRSAAKPPFHVSDSWIKLNRAVQLVFRSRSFVSVSAAARVCGFNRNMFGRLFKEWMGISFPEFALAYRLSGAADRLRAGYAPVKAIAAQWGFVDASHFNRLFVKHYKCYPTEYRRLKNSDNRR